MSNWLLLQQHLDPSVEEDGGVAEAPRLHAGVGVGDVAPAGLVGRRPDVVADVRLPGGTVFPA